MTNTQIIDNSQNIIWAKSIPKTNKVVMITSLVLIFGLDLVIILSSPDLKEFWYLMLLVFAAFIFFFFLENYFFSKRFSNNKSKLDSYIFGIISLRNIIFILNFIPFIQLLGLGALMLVGWIVALIYLFLMIARFAQLNNEVSSQPN